MGSNLHPPAAKTDPAQGGARAAETLPIGSQETAAKPLRKLSGINLWNISIGFLGIQFAWAIQMGQMGPLLERLGSDPVLTGLIFAAGPVTGVLVQPIVGALSDRSSNPLGRRRPFLIAGALLTAFALVAMPNSPNLFVAAALLWLLDASINLTQGPYRALVPDVVPHAQQATTYSLMSLTIGLGSVAAFGIGYLIPSMHQLFYIGAISMLLAMGWTVLSTPESRQTSTPQKAQGNIGGFFADTLATILAMPKDAKVLCLAHSFTWFGLGCLFFFFSLYVPHQIFHAATPADPLYQQGVQWGSLCYAVLNAICFLFSAFIGKLAGLTSKKTVHTLGLICMANSLIGMYFLSEPWQVMVAMGIFGIGWATTLSIPFALLSEHIPSGREGLLMGAFNIFIAAPQVLTSTLMGSAIKATGDNWAVALVIGGFAMIVSAIVLQFVHEQKEPAAHARTTA